MTEYLLYTLRDKYRNWLQDNCLSSSGVKAPPQPSPKGRVQCIVTHTLLITSFLPHSKNKTTTVGDELSQIIHLITSFFEKRVLQLGNEVFSMFAFVRATEVVLLKKLGENEVFSFQNNNKIYLNN